MDASQIGRVLLTAAAGLAVVGVMFLAAGALGLGHLPGDLSFGKKSIRVYVPIASSVILSIVVTVVLNVLARRR